MKTTLTDRYVYAVTRRLPQEQREDVGRELRASIEDMVDGHGAEVSAVAAERAALTDLGDPARLAADYANGPHALIGPALYFDYLRLLKLLLTVIPLVAGAFALAADLIEGAGSVVGVVLSAGFAAGFAAIQVCFWTTLGFVIAERQSGGEPVRIAGPWSPDRLDEVPDRQIGLGETLWGAGMLVVLISLVPFERYNPSITSREGIDVPTFLPSFWNGWAYYAVAVFTAMLLLEVVKYRAGRWNLRLASANLGLNVAFGVPGVWLLLTDRLVNPAAQRALQEWLGWSREPINLTAVAVVVVLLLVWDTADGFLKSRR